jgi:hypothetical protein
VYNRASPDVFNERSLIVIALSILAIGIVVGPITQRAAASTGNTCGTYGIQSCSVSVLPTSDVQGSGFNITSKVTTVEMTFVNLEFMAVVTPANVTYSCGPGVSSPCPGVTEEVNAPCTAPYGQSGTVSSDGYYSSGCSGTSGTAWVEQSSITTLAALELACTGMTYGSFSTSGGGDGNTGTAGTYSVIACWKTGDSGEYATNSFQVTSATTSSSTSSSSQTTQPPSTSSSSSSSSSVNGVPQFPIPNLSAVLLAALILPIVVLMTKARKATNRL